MDRQMNTVEKIVKTCTKLTYCIFEQVYRQIDVQIYRLQIGRYIEGQIDNQFDRQFDRWVERQIDIQFDRQFDRYVDRQFDWQIVRLVD